MKMNPILSTGLLVGLMITLTSAQTNPPKMDPLRNHGLASDALQDVLPGNALVHLEFKDPIKALGEIQQFVVQTIPDKAVPPPMREMINAPNPLLTALGMQLLKAPLSAEALSEKLGIQSNVPISLTLYPGDPRRSFVLSFGVANHGALSGFLQFALHPESMQEVSMNGRNLTKFNLANPNIPQLFAACSDNRIYFSGEPSVLMHLYDSSSFVRMSEEPQFKASRELVSAHDLFITVNPSIIKPILPQLDFYKFLPATKLSEFRTQMMERIGDNEKEMISQRLRMQLGVESLDQFLDYVEIFLTASYEEVFDFVVDQADSFNGVTLASKVDHNFPQSSFFLHMKSFEPGSCVQPIDKASVTRALARIPGKYDHFSVQGQTVVKTSSPRVESWLRRIRSRLESKAMDARPLDVLETMIQETLKPLDPTSEAAWTIQSATVVKPLPAMKDFDSLESYFQGLAKSTGPVARMVNILPDQSPDLLKRVIESQIKAIETNRRLALDSFPNQRQFEPMFLREFRLDTSEEANGVTRFTYENVFKTRGGLFGFNEHELINRKVHYARTIGDYLVYHQASGDPDWISSLRADRNATMHSGVQKLLDRIPVGTVYFRVDQNLRSLPQIVEGLQNFEGLLHRDIAGYLSKAREIFANAESPEAAAKELSGLKFSPLVYSVNHDPESGETYCMLPGGIVFPRPKVTTTLAELTKPFDERADELGGMVCYVRVLPGTLELSMIQSMEAVSFFVKSVGNAVAEQFLWAPDQKEALLKSVIATRDMDPNRFDQIVATNPQWAFLPIGRSQGPWQVQVPREQVPYELETPIPPRPADASSSQIDLSASYNANLNDSWHKGGLEGNHLRNLKQGLQTMAGVRFDVRGVIQLSGEGARNALSVLYPETVSGISINQSCQKIHVLHGVGWSDENGTQIGAYRVHYGDGETRELPIVYGEHVRDWWVINADPNVPKATVAWEGYNEASGMQNNPLKLYKATYENPRPDVKIVSIDFVSHNKGAAPFLIAMTLE